MLTSGMFGYLVDYALWWLLFISVVVHTWCFFRFFPKERFRKLGLVTGNTLVLFCILGAAGLAGETYFRFLSVETDPFGWSVPSKRWFALHTRLNSLGCRDKEWTVEKPPGTRRIAFVGDSFTYGWGIERTEDRFPDRLGAMFTERTASDPYRDRKGAAGNLRVEVMNVAKPGWGTGDQLAPIRDMIAIYDVDEVVLCWVANDIEKLLPTRDDFNPIHPPQPRWFNPDSSCLMDYLYRRISVPRARTVSGYHDWLADGYADPQVWQAYERQLHAIIQLCRERNVRLRVALLPYVQSGGETFDDHAIHTRVQQFFETNNVDVVDLLPSIAGIEPTELMVNSHDAHPNERAHELFAKAIRPVLVDRSP